MFALKENTKFALKGEREREKVSGRLFREKYFPLEKSSSAAAACEEDISYVTKQYDQMME